MKFQRRAARGRFACAMMACGGPLVAVGLALSTAPGVKAETLADAIALAYQSNPKLQEQRASQRALDETVVQAEAGYGPTANVQATVQGATNSYPSDPTAPAHDPVISSPSNTSNAVITLTQPIYTGGRVSSQVSAARASVLAGREQLRAAEQSILANVIEVYSDVLRDQESLGIAKESVAALQRELSDAEARASAGEITLTDVAQTKSRLAAAVAQLAAIDTQLANSRANFVAVVGQTAENLAAPPSLDAVIPRNLEEAVSEAETNSPVLQQSVFTERSSASRVAAARAQAYPTVSLQANLGYYGGSLGPYTPFANYNNSASALAVVSMPLFTSGLISSQVRQALETNNIDRIAIEDARRQLVLRVSQAWNGLIGGKARMAAEVEQVRSAEVAFEDSRVEAGAGLRSTLDVLISEQDLQAARLALASAKSDAYFAGAAVLAAEGRLQLAYLAPGTPAEDAEGKSRRGNQLLVPWTPLVSGLDHLAAPRTPGP